MEPIRVLIADDHPHFRAGLRALLHSAADLELVAEAKDGEQAIALATQLQPDVIVMDLQMPGIGGIDATRRILHTSPHISILVLSMFDDDDSIFAALQAGARGYLLKGALKAEILRAISSRRQRRSHLRPDHRQATDQLLRRPPTSASAPTPSPNSPTGRKRSSPSSPSTKPTPK